MSIVYFICHVNGLAWGLTKPLTLDELTRLKDVAVTSGYTVLQHMRKSTEKSNMLPEVVEKVNTLSLAVKEYKFSSRLIIVLSYFLTFRLRLSYILNTLYFKTLFFFFNFNSVISMYIG